VAMNAQQVLEIFARYRNDAPVMVSSGRSGTILWQLGHRTPTMYNTGMSYTSPACLGLALARPDLKVVAVEGDGAMLMGLANLATIGRYRPRNLVVLVINNRTYISTDRGELETACAGGADLAAAARAMGIEGAVVADTPERFEQQIRQAMLEDGPWMIVANVDRTLVVDAPSNTEQPDRTELSIAFQHYLRDTRPAPAEERGSELTDVDLALVQTEGPGREAARVIYNALKQAGIDVFVYLPDEHPRNSCDAILQVAARHGVEL